MTNPSTYQQGSSSWASGCNRELEHKLSGLLTDSGKTKSELRIPSGVVANSTSLDYERMAGIY